MEGARTLSRRVRFCVGLAAGALAPVVAAAQDLRLDLHPEARVDVIAVARRASWQLGGGAEIPAGYYVRIGVIGAAGADVESGATGTSGRVDVTARFLLDPFRQSSWGLSGGGGVSLRARQNDRVRPYLVALMDLEGPRWSNGVSPSVQLGLGGGVRAGVALRWSGVRTR